MDLCYPRPSKVQATAEARWAETCLAILENILYNLKLCLNTVLQLTVLFYLLLSIELPLCVSDQIHIYTYIHIYIYTYIYIYIYEFDQIHVGVTQ